METRVAIVLLCAALAANLPFVLSKVAGVWSVSNKHVGWCLLELGVLYLAVGGLAYGLESVWQWLRGRHYYWDNRFEVEAYRLGRERFNRPAKRLE